MFSKDIVFLSKFVFNTRQIFSLYLFLNIYSNFKSWGTCKFLRMDSERNNIVQNNNNNYSFIKKHFFVAP